MVMMIVITDMTTTTTKIVSDDNNAVDALYMLTEDVPLGNIRSHGNPFSDLKISVLLWLKLASVCMVFLRITKC